MLHPTWTLIIVVILAVVLFSRPGKISGLMEDLGKGIKGFRKGMEDQHAQPPATPPEPPRQVPDQTVQAPSNQDRVQS